MAKPRKSKSRVSISMSMHPEKLLKKRDKYYLALGHFIDDFAATEAQVLDVLCYYAKADKQTAKALFSGVRVDQAADFIRRLGQARKINPGPLAEISQNLLPQVKAITDLRNDIIHYGIQLNSSGLKVDNQRGVGRTQVRRYFVSAKLLEDASSDLGRINLRFYMAANNEISTSLPPQIREKLFGPWRYRSRVTPQKRPQSPRKRGGSSKAQVQPPQP